MAEKSIISPNILKSAAVVASIGSVAVPSAALAPVKPLKAPLLSSAETSEQLIEGPVDEPAQLETPSSITGPIMYGGQPRKRVKYWYGPISELDVLKQLGTAGNAKLAFELAKKRRWYSHTQVGCVDELWYEESKFGVHSANPSSAAYGIPQANPGSKMASAGKDWQNNATTQINWGYDYTGGSRFQTPCDALAFHNSNGFY